MTDLIWLDATQQAELVAQREVSPRELAEASIARIEQVDGSINAVIHRRFERALQDIEVGLRAGPFRGVSFLIKDLYADSAGDPAHQGNRALKDAAWTARNDSWLVARLRAAGFSFLGRTNTPEFGLVPVTEPQAYGPCRNPWDRSYSPGGSSGGSAAAVAAGMVAVAHASDGGGSIRIPASMCGLVGLKPSRGRTTLGPAGDESGLSVQHVVARSVRDTAALLDVLRGTGPGDMVVAPPPARPYAEEVSVRPAQLRVGLLDTNPAGGPVDPECQAAVQAAARLLEQLGHAVTDDHPHIGADAAQNFGVRWVVNAKLRLKWLAGLLGREVTADDVEPLTWAMASVGETVWASTTRQQCLPAPSWPAGSVVGGRTTTFSSRRPSGSSPLGSGSSSRRRTIPSPPRSGPACSCPSRPTSTPPANPPSRFPCMSAPRGYPSARRSSRPTAGRTFSSRWRPSWRRRAVGGPEAVALVRTRVRFGRRGW